MFSLYWKEGGQRKVRHLACMEEARLIAHRPQCGWRNGCDSHRRGDKARPGNPPALRTHRPGLRSQPARRHRGMGQCPQDGR
jgi:hypothetical protein